MITLVWLIHHDFEHVEIRTYIFTYRDTSFFHRRSRQSLNSTSFYCKSRNCRIIDVTSGELIIAIDELTLLWIIMIWARGNLNIHFYIPTQAFCPKRVDRVTLDLLLLWFTQSLKYRRDRWWAHYRHCFSTTNPAIALFFQMLMTHLCKTHIAY